MKWNLRLFSHLNVFCLSWEKGVEYFKRGILSTLPPFGGIWGNMFFPLKPILQVRPIVGKLLNALSTPSQQVSPFITLETRRQPERKYVPQLFLGSLLLTRRPAIGQFVFRSLVTVPEAFSLSWWILHFLYSWLGSLSNDDGDVNENEKKATGLDGQSKLNFARASRLFVHFFARRCTTTMWQCLISRFVEHVNTRQRLSLSFPELSCRLLEFNSRKICQHLKNWTSWNKHNKVWSSATSLFKWRFRSRRRRRRCCLSFLLLNSLSPHRLGFLSDYTSLTVFFRPYMTLLLKLTN